MAILATFRNNFSRNGVVRDVWALSGPISEIEQALENKNSSFTTKKSNDGKTLITAPWTGPITPGVVCPLNYIEDIDRWVIDTSDQRTILNTLNMINNHESMQGLSDSVKQAFEQQQINDSIFTRASSRTSRFTTAPAAPTSTEETSAETDDASLDQPLEETPKPKAKK